MLWIVCVLLLFVLLAFWLRLSPPYTIASGPDEITRQKLLSDAYDDISLHHLEIKEGMRILTFGCGAAFLEKRMLRLGASVTCVDIEQFADLPEQSAKFRFHRGNICTYTTEEKYDCIHTRFLLSHLRTIDIGPVLTRLRTFLAPGGFIQMDELTSIAQMRGIYDSNARVTKLLKKFVHGVELQWNVSGASPAPADDILRCGATKIAEYWPDIHVQALILGACLVSKRIAIPNFLEESLLELATMRDYVPYFPIAVLRLGA